MKAFFLPTARRPVTWALTAWAVVGCTAPGSGSGSAPAPAPVSTSVAQGRWQVQDIGGVAALADGVPTLEFVDADRAGGTTGCNHWSASYRLQDDTLRLERPIVTKRACPPERMRQEAAFLELLEQPLRVASQPDGSLALTAPDGRAMRLRSSRPRAG